MANSLPTGADLRDRLLACEISEATLNKIDLDMAVAQTIARWERVTGYKPWLASSETETLRFDAPRCRKIEFETGVVEVVSVVCDNRILTEGTDFELEPRRAIKQGKPYTMMAFTGYWPGSPLNIVARVGYTDDVSQEVFELILDGAGGALGPVISAASAFVAASEGGDVKKQTTGDTTIEFAVATSEKTSAMKYEATEWKERFEKAAKAHRLVIVGLND